MAFERPTLQALYDRVEGHAKGLFGVTVILRRSFISIISRVIAGVSHVSHGHLDYISKQVLPSTMDELNLIKFGGLFGLEKLQPTKGEYQIALITRVAGILPGNTVFLDSLGNSYVLKDPTDISFEVSVAMNVRIIAVIEGKDFGIPGAGVTFQSQPIGFNTTVLVTEVFVAASDLETTEDFRLRVLDRLKFPVSSGLVSDYFRWGKEFRSDIERVYVYPRFPTLGSVGIGAITESENNLTDTEQASLTTFIKDRAPLTASVRVFPLEKVLLYIYIDMLPYTQGDTEIKNSITNNIKDFMKSNVHAKGSQSPETGEDYTGEILKSKLDEIISSTDGLDDHLIEFIGDGDRGNNQTVIFYEFKSDPNDMIGINNTIEPVDDFSYFRSDPTIVWGPIV